MRIIPAIDLIDGKCVRLTKGNYSKIKTYNDNPLEVAKKYEAHGIEYLHLVDLDGAKSKHIVNHRVLEEIASKTSLKIDFGGGLKSDNDLNIAFECGAKQITGGSVAIKNPILFESWIEKYGNDKIILGADILNNKIAINGWKDLSILNLNEFLEKYLKKGISRVICTDINKDGMLEGPSFELYLKILNNFSNNITNIRESMDKQNLNFYIDFIINSLFDANKYFNDQEPWKKKNDLKRLNTIVYTSLELIRKISIMLFPIVPESSLKALSIFNIKENEIKFLTLKNHEYLKKGSTINKINILFKKIEKKND